MNKMKNQIHLKSISFQIKFVSILISCLITASSSFSQGLHGYISSSSYAPPSDYNLGAGFYSAIWPLIPKPVERFQIGLPGTWLFPDNTDNKTTALCPPGTRASNWKERGPTFESVFQTIEGSPGYWRGQRFHYPSPKFMMNATPNCYDQEIATPGFSFFKDSNPLPDNALGIAQLSNRLLIPPDGLPFEGNPTGQLMGFSYMALPLTSAYTNQYPVGEKSWTLFLNTSTFKGPLAYFVPEMWAKISQNYPFDHGRGLDSRAENTSRGLGGAMEINTVPWFTTSAGGTTYHKIPRLQFPVNPGNQTIISLDVTYYSASAIYNDVIAWRSGGPVPSGTFHAVGANKPAMRTSPVKYDQRGTPVSGINEIASPAIIDKNAFCLLWSGRNVVNGMGSFPQYYKDTLGVAMAIDSSEVPASTGLTTRTFASPNPNPAPYVAGLTRAWKNPGPSAGPFQTVLADHSLVTYVWYRFIDQPVFQQFNWTKAKKDSLQQLVESIHTHWGITQDYMAPPSSGSLVRFDSHLFVTPPPGYEIGYVPIVIRQEKATSQSTTSSLNLSADGSSAPPAAPSHSDEPEGSSAARFKWFHEAKYGLFINWGLYSIPAGEWNGKPFENIGEWIMYDARIPVKMYEQLARQFNPTKFNADEWAQLAVDAGMKYVVFDCKHHDGFALYHSGVSKYNCYDATPWQRDPFKELQVACAKRGLKLCFYYSQATDWHEPNGANNDWDFPPNPQKDFDQYFRDKSMPQVRELLTNYGPIGLIWFDVPTLMTPVRCQQLVDLVRSLQPGTLINSRLGPGGLQDYQSRGDNEIPHTVTPGVWETAATINDTWGYKKNDHNWKTPGEICFKLVDIVSKGGNYLLNVGPDADGRIPPPSQEVLRNVGAWLKTNGEAIYGAGRTPFGPELGTPMPDQKDKRGQPRFVAKRDWRCTTKPGKIYLHIFQWPATGKFEVPGLQSKVNKAYLLSDRRELKVEQTAGGVSLSLPAEAPDKIASVICLEIADQLARGAEQK